MAAKPMTSAEVAALYSVSVMTVHRWAEAGLFDVAPTRLPGGEKREGAYIFDRDAVTAQYERERTETK